MSDDRQLGLPVDLGTWPPRHRAEDAPTVDPAPIAAAVGPQAARAWAPEVAKIEIVEPLVGDAKIEIVQQPVEFPAPSSLDASVRFEPAERGPDLEIVVPEPETERTCWPSGSGATFSDDRVYRFELWRDTGLEYGPRGGPVAVIIGVNPSVAAEEKNDPTITKDIEFAKRWGCAHVLKVNANAFIATEPDDMRKAFAQGVDIVGPGNDGVIRRACGVALLSKGRLVLAWGKNITPQRQKEIYETIIRWCGVTPMCLGINKDGTPKHTGRIAYDTPLVPWSCPA